MQHGRHPSSRHPFAVARSQFKTSSLNPPPVKIVPAGQEIVMRYPAAVTITGSAFLPGGLPAEGASVVALRGTPGMHVFTTNADRDGRFTVLFTGRLGRLRGQFGSARKRGE